MSKAGTSTYKGGGNTDILAESIGTPGSGGVSCTDVRTRAPYLAPPLHVSRFSATRMAVLSILLLLIATKIAIIVFKSLS